MVIWETSNKHFQGGEKKTVVQKESWLYPMLSCNVKTQILISIAFFILLIILYTISLFFLN